MELTEEERRELLDYLEKEEYVDYNGFHVSVNKIAAVKANRYGEEVYACEILSKQGFDVYLLDEKYVGGRKADAFFKKDGMRDFLELKDTKDEATKQYNRSKEQAPCCFITVKGFLSITQKQNLKNAVKNDVNAKEVYVYLQREGKIIKIK